MSDGILNGIKILEISRGDSAAICAMQLAEAGAVVSKIFAPGPDIVQIDPGYAVWDRDKRIIDIELYGDDPEKKLDSLLSDADVLVHDLGPKAAAALGLDDRSLSKFPALIVAGIPAWPSKHVAADDPHRETLVMASLGILDEQRGHRSGPVFVRMPMATWCAAWLSVVAIMSRLIHRRESGRGGRANTSLAQGALTTLVQLWARAERPSESFAAGMPKSLHWSLFECSDGRWIHLMGSPDDLPAMKAGFESLGPIGVAEANGRWPSLGARFSNPGANAEIFLTRPSQAWLDDLWRHDIPAQLCANLGDIYYDEQARLNDYVIEVDHPTFGRCLQPGVPIDVHPPSKVGRHRDGSGAFAEARGLPPILPARLSAERPPLEGLKVLDFGSFMAGPFGTQCLAELGAEVVKVEAVTGDPKRILHRNFAGSCRGKRSVAIDLRDERSRGALAAMVRWADVVHHNVRAPAAKRLGIDYDSLKKVNPELIYCHVNAYGPEGPRAGWPGYDQMFQSSLGWEVAGGGQGKPPIWYRFGMMDVLCALSSTFATLLAVYHRKVTGDGQAVAASLLGAATLTAGQSIGGADALIFPYEELDANQMGVSRHHRLYECEDDWIAVAALAVSEKSAFDTYCGVDAERFLRSLPALEALSALNKRGAPAELVRRDWMESFFDSRDNIEAGLTVTYDDSAWGRLEQIGALWDFDDLPLNFRYPAPSLGEHSLEFLQEIGVDSNVIEELRCGGVLFSPVNVSSKAGGA